MTCGRPAARLGLLAVALVLAQCHDEGSSPDAEPIDDITIVDAYPSLPGFSQPLFFTQAPGDATRAFVVTQEGVVYAFAHDAAATTTSAFLDIGNLVTDDGGEQGLLGFTFDPAFASNGYLYVNYNPNFGGMLPRRTQISRFQVTSDPNLVDPATETPLLDYDQPFSNHKGGWIGFGPDGGLYIASGDGGSGGDPQNNAQDLDSLLGKILRITPDGSVPASNPFVGTGAPEIWAHGLRNPFRASFDRFNGQLLAGDVGQGEREEVDVIVRGGNYGWRKFEGSRTYNGGDPVPANPIFPIHEYAHDLGRCSIIGGYVYRGSALAAHAGEYFHADFCTGEVWALSPGGVNRLAGTVPGNPSSFGEDLAGELYITSFNGKVYKLVPAP
ncbi:MAG: PQQ-dependent sugar dehydrogenase [Gammaproteobacteria bacterium]